MAAPLLFPGLPSRQEHEHQSACSQVRLLCFQERHQHCTAPCRVPGHRRAPHYSLSQERYGLVSPRLMLVHLWPLAWPMYMPSYMPWPKAQQALLQAEFEELARQHQDLEVRKLEVQHMTRTRNLNAVRDVRVTTATSVAGNRHSHKKEQAPRRASSQIASQKSQTPSRAQPSGLTKR